MSRNFVFISIALAGGMAASGCGQQAATALLGNTSADARYVLSAEPTLAVSVVDFKEQAQNGDNFAVVGRIGGGVMPWIEGRSAFLLVDRGAPLPCADDQCGPECQHCAQEIAECTTVVKFVDTQGKTLPIDSRELLGVKEEETVVVQGVAKRDEAGNVALMASGIYIKR